MKRKILIVDDNTMNRNMLRQILCKEYDVVEARNGKIALDILRSSSDRLSAMLLDIIMPELDGFEVLTYIRSDTEIARIPVIVTTGNLEEGAEVKALSLGANDYIVKPYNPAIILHRLRNTIKLRETAAFVNAAKHDKLTGLYNREAFFEKAEELINAHEPGYYVMACFDIDKFKVINDQFGSEKGDFVLQFIADTFLDGFTPIGGICCRITADNFAVLYPHSFVDTPEVERMRIRAQNLDGSLIPITFSIGRYLVDDITLSASAMYDRASIAEVSIKGRFDEHIAWYNESMREHILREQEIVSEMNIALEKKQFEIWLQPQYNITTGALIGSEALVRWRHPRKGLVSPGVFIPVFEHNGFIYEVDKFVWEQACICLRQWIDEGRHPLPVSVNISRYDVFKEDFVEYLTGLVRKYDIPVYLLRLEITESAFAKSTGQIIRVTKRLMDFGFTLEIDDFGSGYSSLNTLKDVPADILKLDMKFLENTENSSRGGNIVESVIRMAKWLGMSVIAEGVEKQEQAEYLRTIGCNYVQGYLYGKPMPVNEYETLAQAVKKEPKLLSLETVKQMDSNALWDPESIDTLIFNTYVSGACIFEYCGAKVELLRANEKCVRILGGLNAPVEDVLRINWDDHVLGENRDKVRGSMKLAISSGEEIPCEAVFSDMREEHVDISLRASLRMIAHVGERYLFYCLLDDLTAQHSAEARINEVSEQLRFLNDSAHELLTDSDIEKGVDSVLMRITDYFGGTRAYVVEADSKKNALSRTYCYSTDGENKPFAGRGIPLDAYRRWLDAYAKDDCIRIESADAIDSREHHGVDVLKSEGIQTLLAVPFRSGGELIGFIGVDNPTRRQAYINILKAIGDYISVIISRRNLNAKMKSDNEMLTSLMNDIPGGFARFAIHEDGSVSIEYANIGYCKLRGMTFEETLASDTMASLHPDDVERVIDSVRKLTDTGKTAGASYRLRHKDGSYITINVYGRISRNELGKAFLNVYYTQPPTTET